MVNCCSSTDTCWISMNRERGRMCILSFSFNRWPVSNREKAREWEKRKKEGRINHNSQVLETSIDRLLSKLNSKLHVLARYVRFSLSFLFSCLGDEMCVRMSRKCQIVFQSIHHHCLIKKKKNPDCITNMSRDNQRIRRDSFPSRSTSRHSKRTDLFSPSTFRFPRYGKKIPSGRSKLST